jgi:hypothetical protein
MNKPSHQFMITNVLEALRTGSRPSALPNLLLDEFHISEELAGHLSALAIKRHKRKGLGTKPLNELG